MSFISFNLFIVVVLTIEGLNPLLLQTVGARPCTIFNIYSWFWFGDNRLKLLYWNNRSFET